jgi:hypothetical protein
MRFPPLLTAGKGEIIVADDKDSIEAPVEVLASELSHGLKSCRTVVDDFRAKIGSEAVSEDPDMGDASKTGSNIGSRRSRPPR